MDSILCGGGGIGGEGSGIIQSSSSLHQNHDHRHHHHHVNHHNHQHQHRFHINPGAAQSRHRRRTSMIAAGQTQHTLTQHHHQYQHRKSHTLDKETMMLAGEEVDGTASKSAGNAWSSLNRTRNATRTGGAVSSYEEPWDVKLQRASGLRLIAPSPPHSHKSIASATAERVAGTTRGGAAAGKRIIYDTVCDDDEEEKEVEQEEQENVAKVEHKDGKEEEAERQHLYHPYQHYPHHPHHRNHQHTKQQHTNHHLQHHQKRAGSEEEGAVPRQQQLYLELLTFPWFHSGATRADSERILQCARRGSFLVRKSESDPGAFSLSVKISREICIHMKIEWKIIIKPTFTQSSLSPASSLSSARAASSSSSGFVLGEFSSVHSSVPNLIEHFASHSLPVIAPPHPLNSSHASSSSSSESAIELNDLEPDLEQDLEHECDETELRDVAETGRESETPLMLTNPISEQFLMRDNAPVCVLR